MRELKTNLAAEFFGQVALDSPYLPRNASYSFARPSELSMKTIDPLCGDEWDRAAAAHPEATAFHSGAWAKVLAETYGHRPHYFSLSDGESGSALVPMMEVKSAVTGRRGVCLPFSDFCGPLVSESGLTTKLILDQVTKIARTRAWKYVEWRGQLPAEVAAAPNGRFYAHRLDLAKSPNELFDGMSSSVRRALRKAERSGLTVEVTRDPHAMSEFYRLHNRTRRRHGIPPQPRSFFANIQQHLIDRGLGFLVVASLASRPVAAAVFFHFGRNALFKFGASEAAAQEHRPNNLVLWEGVKEAARLGASTLHLGRTDLEHEGLRRFKLSLGAEETLLPYYRLNPSDGSWLKEAPRQTSNLPGAIFRRLPLTINQLAGTVLYPHLH